MRNKNRLQTPSPTKEAPMASLPLGQPSAQNILDAGKCSIQVKPTIHDSGLRIWMGCVEWKVDRGSIRRLARWTEIWGGSIERDVFLGGQLLRSPSLIQESRIQAAAVSPRRHSAASSLKDQQDTWLRLGAQNSSWLRYIQPCKGPCKHS